VKTSDRRSVELAIEEVNEGLEKLHELFVEYEADEQFEDDDLVERLRELREGMRDKYDVGLTLKEQLAAAINNEDYELAASLRDELAALGQPLARSKGRLMLRSPTRERRIRRHRLGRLGSGPRRQFGAILFLFANRFCPLWIFAFGSKVFAIRPWPAIRLRRLKIPAA